MNKLIKILIYLTVNLYLIVAMFIGLRMLSEENSWGFALIGFPALMWFIWGLSGGKSADSKASFRDRKADRAYGREEVMNKVLQVIGNLLLSFVLGLGGIIMLTALPLESDAGGLFYWGLIIAAIPLLIWGRGLVSRLMRLSWHLFKLIHQRWWSAIAFWVGMAFVGLLPPYALIGWIVSVILASPRQVGINRFALRMIFGMMTLAGLWVQLVLS